VLSPGVTVSIAGWTRAVFEPEIAVHLASDVPAGATEASIRAAIAGLGPAVELADLDPAVQDVEGILSGDIFHRHVLLGPADASRAGGSITGVETYVLRDGEEIARAPDAAAPGDLVAILQALAGLLEDNGEAVRAGDVVISGSLVPPIEVAPGQVLRAHIGTLGDVDVRFRR
jgi:2-keto-4-pentenoate hydratase